MSAMFVTLATLFFWLLHHPDAPGPHPFVTRDFWFTLIATVFVLFIAAVILGALGIRIISFSSAPNPGNSINWIGIILAATLLMLVNAVSRKRPAIGVGLTCGLLLFGALVVCIVLSSIPYF